MSWINKLKEYAPHIAGAVLSGGTTLPSLAMKVVSDISGHDIKDEVELESFVSSASPEQMLKIKQADNSFKIKMKELDNELIETQLGDVQNARKSHAQSKMPALICIALTLMVAACSALIFTLSIPEANKEIAYLLFGALLAKWGDSIAYWVSTSHSSSLKNSAIMVGMKRG